MRAPRPPATRCGARAARVLLVPAGDDLADVVERHWSVRWDLNDREPFVQDVLPHPGANLCFEPCAASVHGIITHRRSHRLEGSGETFGTVFRPAVFAGFTAVAMVDLVDRPASLADVFGLEGTALERHISNQVGDTARVEAIESFLPARGRRTDRHWSLRGLEQTRGRARLRRSGALHPRFPRRRRPVTGCLRGVVRRGVAVSGNATGAGLPSVRAAPWRRSQGRRRRRQPAGRAKRP